MLDAPGLWRARAWRYGPTAVALPGPLLATGGRLGVSALVCVAAAGAQAVRLDRAVAAWVAACGLAVAFTVLHPQGYVFAQCIPLFPFAQLATSRDGRRTGAYLLASVGLCVALTAAAAGSTLGAGAAPVALSVLLLPVPLYCAVAAWAHGLAVRRAYAELLLERAERLEHEREQRAELAKRGRIARDLHDVVTQTVGLMVVQIDAAWDTDPLRSRAALREVAGTGRTVLGQLRVMCDAIRGVDDPADGAQRAPGGGLERTHELVARLDAAGVATALQVTGDVARVPPTTALAAERILRESLTNVLRHAGACRADVAVDVGADAVRLRVADDGVGVRRAPACGDGIAGMRERAALAGGTVTVAARAQGGTLVEAALPLAGRHCTGWRRLSTTSSPSTRTA